ncbi:Uma2 family endonuclease [Limnochorda pilosa]|uniref:Putative restriction endonuclease domain-containing protein n=1 Tax=Limnochorda pilosa TaxID=1555112 RepID=A0A0K2SHA3_LIMPI|nr:Uma2 family endonuclease [Limnochorda pilosa]BAS26417.1 hypothetical protein LIP_0560 [Limnochorda pilosa]
MASETDLRATLPMRRWTRPEYERLGEVGVLGPDERTELLEGVIVPVAPRSSRHATGVLRVERALLKVCPKGYHVRTQLPLALGDASEPEPDIAVVPGTIEDYENGHPKTALLVVEVSDRSLRVDRDAKATLYANAGIPVYWIVNLEEGQLEVHEDPSPATSSLRGYRSRRIFVTGESVIVPRSEAVIAVASLLLKGTPG